MTKRTTITSLLESTEPWGEKQTARKLNENGMNDDKCLERKKGDELEHNERTEERHILDNTGWEGPSRRAV